MDPPHFDFKCAPPVWNQCKFLRCYATGATLGCGVTLAVFQYHGGTSRYPQITGPRASEKNHDNYEHRCNSDELTSFSPVAPMLTTPTSSHNTPHLTNVAVRQELVALIFLVKNCPPGAESWFRWFGHDYGSYAVVLLSCTTRSSQARP